MAEQATKRRAPGRPKKAETTAENTAPITITPQMPAKAKKPSIKRREVVNTNKEFEIPRNGGVVFMLPQKGVTVYDEEKDSIREIRYCPNEPSIYVDEQSENARREAVLFNEGRIFVPKNKPNLRVFLEAHPLNMANGGNVFKEVNKKAEAEEELRREFAVSEAVDKVRDSEVSDLLPVAMYFNININAPVSEIRYNLLRIAKRNPQDFLESFDSPQVMTRSYIKQADDYQIIKVKKDGVYWFDSNSLIVSVPVGQDPMDVMTRFCLTEKGASVLSSLEERLEKLG
jgi:hypothetical protein